jgi:hypothetical protein
MFIIILLVGLYFYFNSSLNSNKSSPSNTAGINNNNPSNNNSSINNPSNNNSSKPKPIDCIGNWSDWTACDKSCDYGYQTQTYTITTPASNGGQNCLYKNGEKVIHDCFIKACYNIQDFVEWTIPYVTDIDMDGKGNGKWYGNINDCKNKCDNLSGCVGFSRDRTITDDKIGECWFKKTLDKPNTPNHPTWYTYVKS